MDLKWKWIGCDGIIRNRFQRIMGAHGGGELWTNGMRIVCEGRDPGLRPGSEPFDLAKDKLREANLG